MLPLIVIVILPLLPLNVAATKLLILVTVLVPYTPGSLGYTSVIVDGVAPLPPVLP